MIRHLKIWFWKVRLRRWLRLLRKQEALIYLVQNDFMQVDGGQFDRMLAREMSLGCKALMAQSHLKDMGCEVEIQTE